MKFNLKKFAPLLLISGFSTISHAATINAGDWTTPAKVLSVEIYANTYMRIVTETTDNTSAVCASGNGMYWWPATDALSKETYSTALAAYTAGKRISVSYTDECNISAKRLKNIIIKD